MKSKLFLIAIVSLVISTGVRESLADNGQVALARPLDRITIDGDLADWPPNMPRYLIRRIQSGAALAGGNDFVAAFRVGYDRNALYLAVEVTDESTVADRSRHWNDEDSCSVYLDQGHHHDHLLPVQYNAYGVGLPRLQAEASAVATWFCKRFGEQHRYEWRFDLKSMGNASLALEPGRVVGMEITLRDRDEDGSFTEVTWGPGVDDVLATSRLGDVLLLSPDDRTGNVRGRLLNARFDTFDHHAVNLYRRGQSTPITVCGESRGQIALTLPADDYQVATLGGISLGSFQLTAGGESSFQYDLAAALSDVTRAGPGTKIEAGKTAINGSVYRYLSLRGADLALTQAADGSIWVAADWCGLAHFDGRSLTFIEDQHGERVPCLTVATDRGGRVWGANSQGLFCYHGDSIIRFAGARGLAPGLIRQIIPSPDGILWIRTDGAISRYDGNSFATIYQSDAEVELTSCAVESTSRIWIGTSDGLIRLDSTDVENWRPTRYGPADGLPGLNSVYVRTLLIDPRRKLWVGTSGGLSQFDGETFKNWTKKHGLIDNDVLALAATKDGRIWAATKDGLDVLDRGRFYAAVREMRILDLFVDREENIWIVRGGLLRLDSNRPRYVRTRSGGFVRGRYQVMQADNGTIWTATPQGLVQHKDGVTKTFTTADGLENQHVRCLLQDSQGGIWIGTEGGGAAFFDGQRFKFLTTQQGLSSNHVRALAEDEDGRIWIATSEGVTTYDPRQVGDEGNKASAENDPAAKQTWPGRLSYLTTAHGLPSDNVVSLLSDSKGAIWMGTDSGTCRWNGNSVQRFETLTWVNCFLEDDKGELWAGHEEGLFHFDGTRWKHVATCGDAAVLGLAEDSANHLWLATKGGLKVYDGFAAQTLTTTDGVPDFWCRDVIRDQVEGGVLFISGMHVTRYHHSVSPPPVRIVGVAADQQYGTVSNVRFASSQQSLDFAFHGTSFKTRREDMLYRYRLLGFSDQWKLTRESEASFDRLPPGVYTFEVQAIDRDLSYSDTPATVKVNVDRDYRLAALWGSLGCAIAAVAFLSVSVVRRDRGIRRLNVELDQRVKDRTAKLESEVAENRKLQEQLLQAQKLDAVGTMASGIAHDFNNSLAVITGFAEVAKTNPSDSDELIDHILTAAKQATGTTKNLLTFSQESPGEKVPRDIVQLVRETTGFLSKILPTSIELADDLPDWDSIWCAVDDVQIQQVLVNVAMNARDAMPEGGRISISARKHPHQHGIALLSITDNGIGMTPEVRKRIFDPFFTTKARGQGTGLGMSIVHGIVEDHQGSIEIESAVGEGTTVSILLPQCPPHETEAQGDEPLIRGHGEWILVAEDHREVQSMVDAQLRSAGFEVLIADNGQHALEVLREHESKIRLALLDIDLPVMDGKACLRKIAAEYPELPTILMSGLSSVDPAELVTPFLRKPFDRRALLTMISNELHPKPADVDRAVLVIDDDELVGMSIKAVLASHHVDVHLADGAARALTLLRDHADRIETVLMDWHLPQTDAVWLLGELRSVSPSVRVFVISGDTSLQSEQIQKKGFSRLLQKPVSGSELIEAVRQRRFEKHEFSSRSAV